MVPGTTDTGNHCDDCVTHMTLPFPVTLYDQSFSAGNIGSTAIAIVRQQSDFAGSCLPAPV